jgi:hypothetical protein
VTKRFGFVDKREKRERGSEFVLRFHVQEDFTVSIIFIYLCAVEFLSPGLDLIDLGSQV